MTEWGIRPLSGPASKSLHVASSLSDHDDNAVTGNLRRITVRVHGSADSQHISKTLVVLLPVKPPGIGPGANPDSRNPRPNWDRRGKIPNMNSPDPGPIGIGKIPAIFPAKSGRDGAGFGISAQFSGSQWAIFNS